MLETLAYAASITAPSFSLIALGWLLRHGGIITTEFINTGSRLVFNVGMPVVLFLGMYRLDPSQDSGWFGLAMAALLTLAIAALAWLYSGRLDAKRGERGVFVQGAFRSNLAIVGLAMCESAFGARGLALAALPVGILTAWYNVIAVYLLSATHDASQASPLKILLSVMRNPLIIGVGAGGAASLFNLPMPDLALDTGQSLARMAIPLALLCIGGSISLGALREDMLLTIHSSVFRLVAAPGIMFAGLWLAGIRGDLLVVYLILSGTPAAAAGFVMVQAVGGNSRLAASIIMVTTCASVFSLTLWLIVARMVQA